MKRLLKTLSMTFVVASMALQAGCIEWFGMEEGMIVIDGAIPPDRDDNCYVVADGQTFLAAGFIDTAIRTRYDVPISVTTNLPATVNSQVLDDDGLLSPSYPNYGNADANTIVLTEVEVFLSGLDGQPLQNGNTVIGGIPYSAEPGGPFGNATQAGGAEPRRTALSGAIYNTQTALNQSKAFFVPGLSAQDVALLANVIPVSAPGDTYEPLTVGITMTIRGVTTGGGFVESAPYTFPLSLCNGCTVDDTCSVQ